MMHHILKLAKKYKLVILIYITGYILLLAFSTLFPITHNDSLFVLVSKNLALHGQYAAEGRYFDPLFTTGFPVIIPIAIAIKIFSVGVLQERSITIIFFLGLLTTLYFLPISLGYLSKKTSIICLGLTILLCISSVPEFFLLVFNAYGEIPSLFFYLFSLILLNKYYKKKKLSTLFWVGIMLGLSLSSKYIMAFAVIPTVFLFTLYILKKNKQRNISSLLLIFLITLIPEALFQIYHLIVVGYNTYIKDVTNLFHTYKRIDEFTNAIIPTNNNFYNHLNLISKNNFSLTAPLVVCFLTAYILLFRLKPKNYVVISMIFFVILIYFWWLFVTHNLLIRHLVPGTIIFEFIFSICLSMLYAKFLTVKKRRKIILVEIIVIMIGILTTLSTTVFANNINIKASSLKAAEQHQVAEFIIHEKNHANYYKDIFKEPAEIAFLLTNDFPDFYNPQYKIGSQYKNNLVLSKRMFTFTPNIYTLLIQTKCDEIKLKTDNYLICTLKK